MIPKKTLVIDNFAGKLTRYGDGDINSGFAKYSTTFGNDPFSKPGNLTWFEKPIQIDPTAATITDTIVAAKTRVESGTTFVYAIGSPEQSSSANPRFYKIQVNNTSSKNPNFDSPSLLSALVVSSVAGNTQPSFPFGSSMNFYGTTERVYMGGSRGVYRVDFDGSNATYVGHNSSYISGATGSTAIFLGKLYYANSTNLVEIDSTGTVTNYAKLNPGFPTNTTIRDLKVSPDGNYLQIVVSTNAAPQINAFPTGGTGSGDSYVFLWNGTDQTYTAYTTYNGYSMSTNKNFGQLFYTMGQDSDGGVLYQQTSREVSLPKMQPPVNNAVFSSGNMLGFALSEYNPSSSVLQASISMYGKYDREVPEGLFRVMKTTATSPSTDVVRIPVCLPVSNNFYSESSDGYAGHLSGVGKLYYSTFESTSSTSVVSGLYKFTTVPTGLGSVMAGVYETQTQLFSKKITASEVRVYTEPLVANNGFSIDLIGSSGNPISGGTSSMIVGNNASVGQDYYWYKPTIAPTYALAVRITNSGSVNTTISKIEIDTSPAGK